MNIYTPNEEYMDLECPGLKEFMRTCDTSEYITDHDLIIPWNKGLIYKSSEPYPKERGIAISNSKKGIPHPNQRGGNHPRAKAIICNTTGEIFGAAAEAADKYNLSRQNLSAVLRGKQKSISGMHFSFYNK
jgi:hypothetical protein